jgi:hypothetical protein
MDQYEEETPPTDTRVIRAASRRRVVLQEGSGSAKFERKEHKRIHFVGKALGHVCMSDVCSPFVGSPSVWYTRGK